MSLVLALGRGYVVPAPTYVFWLYKHFFQEFLVILNCEEYTLCFLITSIYIYDLW